MKIVVLDHIAVSTEGVGKPAYFSTPTINYLKSHGHDVKVLTKFDIEICADADLVWTEWCNELAHEAAESGVCKRLVCRMRGYDVWYPLDQYAWENVSALIYESVLLKEIAEERFPELKSRVLSRVIPAGVDLDRFKFKERPSNTRVVMAARADHRKGHQLAIQWARHRPTLEFHFACALDKHNPRLMRYLSKCSPSNVKIYSEQDTATWVNQIDPSFALSTSSWEDFGYSIAESMALGCKPLIYAFPGVEKIWPKELIWRTFEELDKLVVWPVESKLYREYVAERFDSALLSVAFAEFVLNLPARNVSQISVGEAPTVQQLHRRSTEILEELERSPQSVSSFTEEIEEIRSLSSARGPLIHTRSHLALAAAASFYKQGDYNRAEQWALRALQGIGPQKDILAFLGEISLRLSDTVQALSWYEAADAIPPRTGPRLIKSLIDNMSERISDIRHTNQEEREIQWSKKRSGAHVLIIQTAPRPDGAYENTCRTLQSAGIENWPGPKCVVSDGYAPSVVPKGFKLFPSTERLGNAGTFLRALRLASVIPNLDAVTLIEDDVRLAVDALDLAQEIEIDADVAFVSWGSTYIPVGDVKSPSLLVRPIGTFAYNWMVTIPARAVRAILADADKAPEGTLADHVAKFAIPGSQYGLVYPNVVQHDGDQSLIDNPPGRVSTTYVPSPYLVTSVTPKKIDEDKGHVLIVQTAPRTPYLYDRTMASLRAAGSESWPGPKIVVADGYTPSIPEGWSVVSSQRKLGHAKTLLRVFEAAAETPGFSALTLIEDDVVMAKNALTYIRSVAQASSFDLVSWYTWSTAIEDEERPILVRYKFDDFSRLQMATIHASVVREILRSKVLEKWTREHGGDLVFDAVVPHGWYAFHVPSIAQHEGEGSSLVGDSTIGNRAKTFVGENFDAMSLLDRLRESS